MGTGRSESSRSEERSLVSTRAFLPCRPGGGVLFPAMKQELGNDWRILLET